MRQWYFGDPQFVLNESEWSRIPKESGKFDSDEGISQAIWLEETAKELEETPVQIVVLDEFGNEHATNKKIPDASGFFCLTEILPNKIYPRNSRDLKIFGVVLPSPVIPEMNCVSGKFHLIGPDWEIRCDTNASQTSEALWDTEARNFDVDAEDWDD